MGAVGKGFRTIAVLFGCPDNTQEMVFCGLIFFFFFFGWSESIPRAIQHDLPRPHPMRTVHLVNQNSANFAVILKTMCRLKAERYLLARAEQWQVGWEQGVAMVQAGTVRSLGADLQNTSEVSWVAAVVIHRFWRKANASQTNPK